MRAFAFIFAFYLIFAQMLQAHAIAPIVVATAKGGGALVKAGIIAHGATALAKASYKWCKANKVKCAALIGSVADLVDDTFDTSSKKCWVTNDVDETLASSPQESCQKASEFYSYFAPLELVEVGSDIDAETGAIRKTYICRSKSSYFEPRTYYDYSLCLNNSSDDENEEKNKVEREKREKQIYDALKDKLSDDDITNIVNNYGDDIDIDKYCASGATCYFIDSEFEKEINNKDYDIEKITNQNCETENGKIKSCEKAKKHRSDDDDDGQTENKDKDKEDPQTNKDKDGKGVDLPNLPIFELPDFCSWATWFCDNPKEIEGDKVKASPIEYKNPIEFDTNYINFGGACPVFNSFNVMGVTLQYDLTPFCDFAVKVRPAVLAMAYFWAFAVIINAFKVGA